jgi:hypothetical protein
MAMKNYIPLRLKPRVQKFKKGDLLVLFGELFNRGYANGLVEEAEKAGMTVIRATVGRRDEHGQLRALTPQESENIPKPFINIPLEAGFDMEPDDEGLSPIDRLKDVKLSDWQTFKMSESSLKQSQTQGRKRFKTQTSHFISEVEKYTTPGCHVHFAHLMAGGVPRCKIVMPLMNRVFKGVGDRFIESKVFWDSGISAILKLSFHEVTAQTFNILIEESADFRKKIESQNGTVSYVAYGYHGTEIVVNNKFQWQSYAPYIQGWAKIDLENFAKAWSAKGVTCSVYNCPEILTNSSSIFQGVEIPLYNLIRAFELEAPHSPVTKQIKADCKAVLNSEVEFNDIFKIVDDFINSPETQKTSLYENWPQHSVKEQLALALVTSEKMISLHKDQKVLMTFPLSELIFRACGYIMLHDGKKPLAPVSWIGHDVIAKCLS